MAVEALLNEGDFAVVPNFGEFSSRLGDSVTFTGAKVSRPEARVWRRARIGKGRGRDEGGKSQGLVRCIQ